MIVEEKNNKKAFEAEEDGKKPKMGKINWKKRKKGKPKRNKTMTNVMVKCNAGDAD